jgi:uncharacterized protein YjbI with pentapeptide repeats
MVRIQAIGLPGRGCLSAVAVYHFGGADAGKIAGDGEAATTFTEQGSSVFDAGLPKVRGEVLVEGSAFSPEPVIARQVRLALGTIDKSLYVVGDRTWSVAGASAPAPFQQIRVSWENALGGEGDLRNSLGKGRKPIETERGKEHPLPNVEWPGRLLRSPRDDVPPAGFGPLDLTWAPRSKRVGTYGERWLKTRYPDLPEDFDPLFFQVAPEDQWLPGYVEGEEAFVIENMHPDKPRIEGKLPGLVARGFVKRRADDRPLPVPMHCDTIWFFPAVERVALVWRGVFPVATDDETEVTEVLVALERQGAPRPLEHYDEVRRRRLDRKHGPMHSLRDSDLLPEGLGVRKPQANDGEKLLLEREGSLEDNMRRRAELELERVRQQVRDVGLDPDASLPKKLPPPEDLPTDDLVALMDTIDERVDVIMKESEERRARAMDDFREQCRALKMDPDEVIAREKRRSLGPPKFSAKKELETLEGLQTLSATTGVEMPPEVYEKLRDPALERNLVEVEAQMKEAYRATVHRAEAMPPLDAEDAQRLRAEVEEALRNGESLAGRDFSGVDLSGIDFSGADLSEAFLESANLTGCIFDGAKLVRAVLAHARAPGVSFKRAALTGANLGGANLDEADFGEASDLTRTVFFRASMRRARLDGARLDEADFTEATLDGASLRGCKATEILFSKVSLAGVDMREATFSKCNFFEVELGGADFTSADMHQSALVDVTGDKAIFRGASLVNLRVVKAEKGSRLRGADFRGANLTMANLRGADLAGSDFTGALMKTSDFSETDLTSAKLAGVRAMEARFERANLSSADMRGADLMNAVLTRANVAGADFEQANLFRADGARMTGDDKTSFTGANLKSFRFVRSRGDDRQS